MSLDKMIEAPPFPSDAAFKFGFDVYRDAYCGIDWICDGYNFAIALAHVSNALGRKYVIREQGQHYPNFYQCLLGRSHLAAKSPSLDRARSGVDYLKRNTDPPEMFQLISSINSVEGFRETFGTHENGDPDVPMDWYSRGNGVRGFLTCDEFGTLLSKTRQTATAGISVELTRLYNPSEAIVENNTRKNKTYGEGWTVNVLACSTMEWYERFVTAADYFGGFLNRFVFYLHEQMPIKVRFDAPNLSALSVWEGMIKGITRASLERREPQIFMLSDKSLEAFEPWYLKIYGHLLETTDDIEAVAGARIVSQVLKLAMVYSILKGVEGEVPTECLQSAMAVGDYWAACAGLTIGEIRFDKLDRQEQLVLKAIARVHKEDSTCTRRMLRRAINTKSLSSGDLNRTLEALVNADLVGYEDDGKTNKIWLKTDIEIPEKTAR